MRAHLVAIAPGAVAPHRAYLPSVVALALSPAVIGLQTATVQVEVDLRAGLPGFSIVGLPDTAVQEARERVRSGLANQVFTVPPRRIVANLAPADLRKAGPQYDLPIALALLAGSGQLDPAALEGVGAAGELALDGRLRPVPGVLAMAEHAAAAGWRRLVVPASNGAEAALVGGIDVVGAASLREAVDVLEGRAEAAPPTVDAAALLRDAERPAGPDLADVRGQPMARRALEVAAAGGHSLLMVGPPGGGKTMLARRLPGILPPLELDEAISLTRIHSVAGLLEPGAPLVTRRPFRAPHHTISAAGLIGGGRLPRPGEMSIAHHGVLFIDEVCAFAPAVLDALRQPLEEGWVDVVRSMASARFPARPLLVCAGNPCPCGFDGDPTRRCSCLPGRAEAYRSRLSGPVADRIDLRVEVPRLQRDELLAEGPAESSAAVRARVGAAIAVRRARGQKLPNAQLSPAAARRAAALDADGRGLLTRAVDRLGLSARGHDRLLRVARTVADLAGAEAVAEAHLAEALGFRAPADRPLAA
ncbi:MAG: magnesium chelatase family protein [Miltoncostaeaceae bacterium]|nr:magnesium chelatase family protein [Miltoncostaeaceae bacterium]